MNKSKSHRTKGCQMIALVKIIFFTDTVIFLNAIILFLIYNYSHVLKYMQKGATFNKNVLFELR